MGKVDSQSIDFKAQQQSNQGSTFATLTFGLASSLKHSVKDTNKNKEFIHISSAHSEINESNHISCVNHPQKKVSFIVK